jgi:hypothetical protein
MHLFDTKLDKQVVLSFGLVRNSNVTFEQNHRTATTHKSRITVSLSDSELHEPGDTTTVNCATLFLVNMACTATHILLRMPPLVWSCLVSPSSNALIRHTVPLSHYPRYIVRYWFL